MAKTKLSIYLVKEGVANPEDYIDLEKVANIQQVGSIGTLYIRQSYPNTPQWVSRFFGNSIDPDMLISSTASALLAVEVPCEDGDRIFLLSFGYGYTLRRRNAIDERFGLRTVLNLANPDSLRSISRTTVAGNAMKTSEQLPVKASIHEFALDMERDLLEKVTITSDSEAAIIKGSVTGGESLALSVDISLDGIVEFLQSLFRLYVSTRYRESFSFVDHIMPVRNEMTAQYLDMEAVRLINEGSHCVWMAVPEMVKWEDTAGFKISGLEGIQSDVFIGDVLRACGGSIEDINILKRLRVSMMDVDGAFAKESWVAYQCLYGELQYEDGQYCINNGKWYHINNNYSEMINSSYQKARISDVPFPECPVSSYEGVYNEILALSGGAHYVLMDRKNVYHGGVRDQVELCDVLTDEGKYIHIKNYSGSATLSHLFNQGYVSAELMKSDASFVEKAQERVKEVAPDFKMDVSGETLNEVVYGIISKDSAELPNIPFFSKVTFRSVERKITAMGIKVSIKSIKRS